MPKTDVIVELYYSGGWHDITSDVRVSGSIRVTRGKPDQATRTPPSTLNLMLDNRDGTYSPRNPMSPLFGLIGRNTPIRVSVDGVGGRFTGEVESWPQRWAVKGDAWTPITAHGITRRLGAPGSAQRAQSPVRRYARLSGLVAAHWPMEGYDQQPGVVASAVPGVPDALIRALTPSVASPLDWRGDATLAGSRNLPVLESNRTSLAGIEVSNLSVSPDPGLGLGFWTRTFIPTTDNSHSINTQAIQTTVLNSGSAGLSLVLVTYPPGSSLASVPDDGEVILRASYTVNGTPTQVIDITDLPFVDGWRFACVRFVDDSPDIDVLVTLDGETVGTGLFTNVALGTITRTTFNYFVQDTAGEESARLAAGHPMVLSGPDSQIDVFGAGMVTAGDAHTGESAYERISRLCDEDGVPLTVVGDTGTTQTVGPQRTAPFLDLLQDAVDVDCGILYEPRDTLGVALRTGASLYNQTAVVELGYDAGDEVAPPLEPVDDTDAVVNDVTVTRYGGSSAHAEQASGPLNTSDPSDDPQGVGRYAQDVTLVLAEDAQCAPQASWRVHLGTVDEARYPVVNMDLTAMTIASKTALVADAAALDVGDRLTITDPPAWLPPDDINQVALGFTEELGSHHWTIAANCTPYAPYNVGEVGAANRVGASDSQTNEAMDTTETGMDVVSGTYRWIDSATYSAMFPFDVMVGGERMTVTAITGTGLTQTMTVTRSVNGVVKTHPSGTAVQVFDHAVVAL